MMENADEAHHGRRDERISASFSRTVGVVLVAVHLAAARRTFAPARFVAGEPSPASCRRDVDATVDIWRRTAEHRVTDSRSDHEPEAWRLLRVSQRTVSTRSLHGLC